MEHLLTCTCGQKIPVMRSQAGQELTCECGHTLQIPTLRGLVALPLAPTEPHPATLEERRPWGGWRGTIMAISIALLAIFGLPCGYFLFIRSQIDTSYTMESEIAAGNANYDAMGMEQLAAEWIGFEKNGFGPKDKPWFYYLKAVARENEILATVTGAVATLAGLTALGVWLSIRNKSP